MANGDEVSADVRRMMLESEYWDPHFVFERIRRKDLVQGVTQLAASVGISQYLPNDYNKVLAAMFAYRNKMFHHGFEWPTIERRKFSERITLEGWPLIWFEKSTREDEPWIYYMSPLFVERCIVLIEEILEGVGRFLADREPGRA